ncbi:type II toxin-antitoxin system RelE/ParE family toxin [Saccharobesus litoralis]|uniref:Toxin n=1 Tax=Saccharobesus litoralis TaxID=2172099 RepID=A0A2S0VUN8_9ALTE|nr:type II toxin-antitoxin system RelE/ParE family toxin [Saccharobesus litoralis]AWB67903.1 type II toxin-antitoxin system RelE/ParE family toxin [Saccharobesus litoralis]
MAKYRLSEAADKDFDQLFEYGIDNFGLSNARSYVEGLAYQFHNIAANPLHYQAVDDICAGYRRSVFGKHAIYYTIGDDSIHIMRILRAEDPTTSFN